MNQVMDRDALLSEVANLEWWHSIDLGQGVITPGLDMNSREKLQYMQMPADLHGKSVLYIGAWDGFWGSGSVCVDFMCSA